MQKLSIPASVVASDVAAQKPTASTTTKSVPANLSNPVERKTRSPQKGNQDKKSDRVPKVANDLVALHNERKSEQAHIPHAPTLLENAVYNEWQFQALGTGNRTKKGI